MDRVSNLPDEILSHIVSYLPTKYAASTPALSKRWLNLWKIDPNYDIDDSVFHYPQEGKAEKVEIRQAFVDFVDAILAMQGDSPIHKFSLKCVTGIHPDIVNRWIRVVLKRGVSDLNLFLDFSCEDTEDESHQLPEELFLCNTLVKLKLRSEHCVDWWRSDIGGKFLPLLKTLYINGENTYYGDIQTFTSSFPVLEEFWMANVSWLDMDMVVRSASFRKLTLLGTGCEGDPRNPKRVSFDIPTLLFLNYTDCVAGDYPLVNMKSLLGARIDLMVADEDQVERFRMSNGDWLEENDENDENDEDDEDDEGDVGLHFGNVVKLMNGLQNVHRLTISADTLEVLSLCGESMPLFNNLKFLSVTSDKDRGWQAMPVLLRNCPHLETIIIEGLLHYVTDKCGDACPCISRENKGRSLTSCPVIRLEIQGFRATMQEMNMIKHFMDYFPSLERLDVFVEENDPTPLRNPEVSKLVTEMFDLYNQTSNCKVDLLVSDNLEKKWTAQGHM